MASDWFNMERNMTSTITEVRKGLMLKLKKEIGF